MSVESTIVKLQKVAKDKETQRSERGQRQEEEVEVLKKKNRSVENKGECWNAKHLAVGSDVTVAFIIIFGV